MTTFHAIASGRNCGQWARKTINSILKQHVPAGCGLVVHAINDGSNDDTHQVLVSYTANSEPEPVRLYWNSISMGAAYSRMQAIRSADVKPDDICFLIGLDGDELAHPRVLERVWHEYQDGADMTYGSWEFTFGGRWEQQPYDEETVTKKAFRQRPWRCSPLQTFRARLVQDLPDEVFQTGGKWLPACTELALLFPAMERAEKMVWIPETLVLYHYTPKSTRRVYGSKKLEWAQEIRGGTKWTTK